MCAEQTLAAGGVKVDWQEDWGVPTPLAARWSRRQGGPLSLSWKLVRRIITRAWKQATRDFHFGHLAAKGVIEPRTGRYMIDFGSFAQIHDGAPGNWAIFAGCGVLLRAGGSRCARGTCGPQGKSCVSRRRRPP